MPLVPPPKPTPDMAPTELEVRTYRALEESGSYIGAADELGLPFHTVRSALHRLYRRIGAKSAANAGYLLRVWGYLW